MFLLRRLLFSVDEATLEMLMIGLRKVLIPIIYVNSNVQVIYLDSSISDCKTW